MATGAAVMERAKGREHGTPHHIEAVERRRANRKAAHRVRAREDQVRAESEWEVRRQKERELAARMCRRFYPANKTRVSEIPHVICMDYRFWQARRCGINVLAPMFWDGQSDVWRAGTAWSFWVGMHYEARAEFAKKHRQRLTRF